MQKTIVGIKITSSLREESFVFNRCNPLDDNAVIIFLPGDPQESSAFKTHFLFFWMKKKDTSSTLPTTPASFFNEAILFLNVYRDEVFTVCLASCGYNEGRFKAIVSGFPLCYSEERRPPGWQGAIQFKTGETMSGKNTQGLL